MHFAMHLGGDDDLVPIGEVLQSASEDLLTRANGIDVGGIEEIDPQLEGFLDDRPAVFFVQHPFVNPPCRVPEPHAAEADARHIHSGVSELRVFHMIVLSFLLIGTDAPTLHPQVRGDSLLPSCSSAALMRYSPSSGLICNRFSSPHNVPAV